MRISDVYSDYVAYIAIVTLIFGFIGTFIAGVISSSVNGKKHL